MTWLRDVIQSKQRKKLEELESLVLSQVSDGVSRDLQNYTLHGEEHYHNIEYIISLILRKYKSSINNDFLNSDNELYYLLCSIYVHDIAMFMSFTVEDLKELEDKVDPNYLSDWHRKLHNRLPLKWIGQWYGELQSRGFGNAELQLINEVSSLHSQRDIISESNGFIQKIACLLRLADELDVCPNRAPMAKFKNQHKQFNTIQKRHWIKHLLSHEWTRSYNVKYKHDMNLVIFKIGSFFPNIVYKPFIENLIYTPIAKEFSQCKLDKLLQKHWNIDINVEIDSNLSSEFTPGYLTEIYLQELEHWMKETDTQEFPLYQPANNIVINVPDIITFSRPSDNIMADRVLINNENKLGEALVQTYKSEFSPIVARRYNKLKFENVWTPPKELGVSHDLLTNAYIQGVSSELSPSPLINHYHSDSVSILRQVAESLKDELRSIKTSNRSIIIVGERGTGKTVTINAILTVNRKYLRRNKIFWVRLSVYHEIGLNETDWTERHLLKAYSDKFVKMVFKNNNCYFQEFIKEGIFEIIAKRLLCDNALDYDLNTVWATMENRSKVKPLTATKIISEEMSKAGYGFILITDNVDMIESDEYLEENKLSKEWRENRINSILKVATMNTFINVQYLNIIVARGSTFNKILPKYFETRMLNRRNVKYIGLPDPGEVLANRLKFAVNAYNSNAQKYELGGSISLKTTIGKLVEIFNNYLLDGTNGNKPYFILSGAAGDCISDIFDFSLCIIGTHLINMEDVLKGVFGIKEAFLKEHEMLWALMLPNNRLYYKSLKTCSNIYNIYSNYNDHEKYNESTNSSPILKRILLEYFINKAGDMKVRLRKLLDLFSDKLKFTETDIMMSLSDLTEWGLLAKMIDRRKNIFYAVTPKAEFYYNYVQNQFIYHELIIEDTCVPEKLANQCKLFKYTPMKNKLNYFNRKCPMVYAFCEYLRREEKRHLGKIGKESWFDHFTIFPELSAYLSRQEKIIRSALS